MNHCHFTILYNELPFLKQKLDFLYKNFQQLIFFDLNINTMEFSDDGSHEYIKYYPDPENKITLIEKKDLSGITNYNGRSFIEKQKMFSEGSSYVRDDIDFFWCSDMDEFFFTSMIKAVEMESEKDPSARVFDSEHFIFWKSPDLLLVRNNTLVPESYVMYPRIARHKRGTVYGHCNLDTLGKVTNISYENFYHFAFIGDKRMRYKWYSCYYKDDIKQADKYYNSYNTFDSVSIEDHKIYGYPDMYPNKDFNGGIIKFNGNLPISPKQLMEDFK